MTAEELINRTEQHMTGQGDNVRLDTEDGQKLAGMFGKLETLRWLNEEDCLLGTVFIFGVPHHVTFVRVHFNVDDVLEATNDPHKRLDDILSDSDYDGTPQTVELPGFEGEWVIGVDPFR